MYSGVVSKVYSKPFGNKVLHSFQLNGDRTYYSLGENSPNFNQGQTVQFDGKPGNRPGSVYVQGQVNVVDQPSNSPDQYSMTKQSTTGARRSADVMDKDQYWRNREESDKVTQKRIEIQAARNAAIAALGNITQYSSTEEYLSQLNELTDEFLANNEARLNG